jgi:3-deoxy-manno-octulosonate cytidylyltransferase (CMP-KDO synthetase)
MNILSIIPARFGSTRFPGKPLADLAGKPMIQRVYEQVISCSSISDVIVATDHMEIFNTVQAFGGRVIMTSENCLTGTDRCAEVLEKISQDYDLIINVQGDEPFIQCGQINELIESMASPEAQIGTLVRRIEDKEDVFNPNVVKAVLSMSGRALYFSRNPMPFVRGANHENWLQHTSFFRHIGLYAYRPAVLREIAKLPAGKLEIAESLEQLRWLEAGYSIFVRETHFDSPGIDTPEDLENARRRFHYS